MKTTIMGIGVLGLAALAGCQSDQQYLQSREAQAVEVALNRGRFEMNCPQASGTVLNMTMLQPAIEGIRFSGPERAEYTIGVSGCGERATYLVICPLDGGGCWSAGARNIIR